MTLAELVPLAIKLSIMTLVFALGLKTDAADLLFLWRRPWQLIRSLLSINLIMPLVAAVIVRSLALHPPVGLMVFALSLAPLPPILPNKHAKAGGDVAYAISLMVTAALFAIVSIPLSISVVGRAFGLPLHVAPLAVTHLVLSSVFIPLGAGLLVRHFLPKAAEKLNGPLSKIATLFLALAVVAILVTAWKGMLAQIGDGTLLALAAFTVVGLLVGHLLGGPDPGDRTVLALSTASRHPGIALALIHMTVPGAKAVLPVLLLYLIASTLISLPYVAWRKKIGVSLPSL